MATLVHELVWPDRVVVGTVGSPGSRSFYLQARSGRRLVSVALEKEQSALLAEKIDEILDHLMTTDGNPFSVPSSTPIELVDNEPLEQPVEQQFRTGTMSLGWDPSTVQLVIEMFPIVEADADDRDPFDDADEERDDTVEPSEMVVVKIPVGTARAFAKRTREVVGAGRPLCPFCATPIDPEGHTCVLPDGF
ncbi:DUF3090 domain-containing protein [Marisediminicola sp. LYQ134]|uniref:DUF3090 domain-containing protein n=1 Tax=Marisediminicola sp. LYQ134 TaxID=3391061 RepID=UPI003983966C